MNRLQFLCSLLLGFAGFFTSRSVQAEPLNPLERSELRRMLVQGLKAVREGDEAFIDRVLNAVERPGAPIDTDLVKAVFQDSRQRYPRYPFVYFREMMIRIAEKRGVRI